MKGHKKWFRYPRHKNSGKNRRTAHSQNLERQTKEQQHCSRLPSNVHKWLYVVMWISKPHQNNKRRKRCLSSLVLYIVLHIASTTTFSLLPDQKMMIVITCSLFTTWATVEKSNFYKLPSSNIWERGMLNDMWLLSRTTSDARGAGRCAACN